MVIEIRLLSVSDLVVAEAKYQKLKNFKNSPSSRFTPLRPSSERKLSVFLSVYRKFEDEMKTNSFMKLCLNLELKFTHWKWLKKT